MVWTFLFFFRNDLGKLKYVLLCIKESNRLYSVVPQISRVLEKPYEIDGKMVDEGKLVANHNLKGTRTPRRRITEHFNDVMLLRFVHSSNKKASLLLFNQVQNLPSRPPKFTQPQYSTLNRPPENNGLVSILSWQVTVF